ncbi:MAG TPA: pirin family protein [Sphingobium sp.]
MYIHLWRNASGIDRDRSAMPELSHADPLVAVRAISRIAEPTNAQHGAAFSARRMGASAFGQEGDPFLNLDHFRMGGPTFPPHAHAGFSAVTYMLPESQAGMHNRDSRGDSSVIPPGGIHWTTAGSGIVHEEVPEREGVIIEGFQIFIRQPVAQESEPPIIHHADPEDVPAMQIGRGSVRVLAGRYRGVAAPFETPSPLALIDVDLPDGEVFDWTAEAHMPGCAIYLFAGWLAVDRREIKAPALILFERGDAPIHCIAREHTRLMLLAGAPLDAPSVSNGPFVLSSHAALEAAVSRYHSGAMGRLY